VLSGQVICEISGGGGWARGYVYLGEQLLAIQDGAVVFVHQDPVTKSQRLTDTSGNPTSTRIELDPFGGDTSASANGNSQPYKYTSYERDGNGSDYAMARSRNTWFSRFYQPDPYDGSYNLSDPQSFNRYSYVQNDPVNFVDPSGLSKAGDSCNNGGGTLRLDAATGGLTCVNALPEETVTVNGGGGGGIGGGFIGFIGGSITPYPLVPLPSPVAPNPVTLDPPQTVRSSNRNCIMNALSSSRGLARTFGNVLPNGTIDHPGVHALAPLGERVSVSTLPALTGTVLGIHIGGAEGGDGTHIVDVLLDNGNVGIYADLDTVNVHPRQRLNAGTVIGTVGGSSNPRDYSGLHFGLLKGNGNGRAADRAYRNRTANHQLSPAGNFINPLGPNSPVNCPGITADPAGVSPAP